MLSTQQARLPLRRGGLGLVAAHDISAPAYLGGMAITAQFLARDTAVTLPWSGEQYAWKLATEAHPHMTQSRTQVEIEAEAAEVGRQIWAQVAERERQRQQPDMEQVRRARTERLDRARPSPEQRQQPPRRQPRPASPPLGQPSYRQMSNRELRRCAYRRLGPGWYMEMESRGNRRRAMINLLESCD